MHRVLQLTDNLRVGGLQRTVVALSETLATRGVDVGIAAEAEGKLWSTLSAEVARIAAPARNSLASTIRYVLWLRRVVRSENWHIVHVHQRGVALLARIAVLGTSVPVVEHVHSVFSPSGLKGMLSFRGQTLIACGSAVAKMLTEGFGRPASKVEVVQNAIRDLGASADLTLPYGTGDTPKIIGIGRLVQEKDPLRFVETIRALNRDGLRVTAEWVGDGPLRSAVLADLAESPVQGMVFSGSTDDVLSKILGADLLLLSSRQEGLPLAILEAMSLGRAVVAPDVGSCSDVVQPGINGLLYPKELSGEEIARTLRVALQPAQLRQWGWQSRRLFVELGSLDVMAASICAVYDRVSPPPGSSVEKLRAVFKGEKA
jgi:glycosyltransferase involved in cell wall biosynthesis